MISPGVVAAIHLAGVRGEPCGAVRIANWKTKDSVPNNSKHSLTSICS